jgi:predicted transposase/invertase (TIGR01784 family)
MNTKKKKDRTRIVLSFDYAMKKLLRQKSNFKILEGFLSELLFKDVKIVKILEGESNQQTFDDKQTRVDILAEDTDGELIIIEVQYQFEIDYLLRILYGVSRHIAESLHKGDEYYNVKKVYSISILYFDKFNNDKEYIYHGLTEFRGMHNNKVLPLTEEQRRYFEAETPADLYPEYYLLDVTNFDDVAKSTLDEWIYYLKHNEVKESFTAKGMKEVREHLDYEKLSEEEKRRYDKALDRKLGLESTIKSAKIEGRYEGFDEGIVKGREEGMVKGREEGRESEKLNVARKAKSIGLSNDEIRELTGLTDEEISNL